MLTPPQHVKVWRSSRGSPGTPRRHSRYTCTANATGRRHAQVENGTRRRSCTPRRPDTPVQTGSVSPHGWLGEKHEHPEPGKPPHCEPSGHTPPQRPDASQGTRRALRRYTRRVPVPGRSWQRTAGLVAQHGRTVEARTEARRAHLDAHADTPWGAVSRARRRARPHALPCPHAARWTAPTTVLAAHTIAKTVTPGRGAPHPGCPTWRRDELATSPGKSCPKSTMRTPASPRDRRTPRRGTSTLGSFTISTSFSKPPSARGEAWSRQGLIPRPDGPGRSSIAAATVATEVVGDIDGLPVASPTPACDRVNRDDRATREILAAPCRWCNGRRGGAARTEAERSSEVSDSAPGRVSSCRAD